MLARNFLLSEIRKALLEADEPDATTEPTPPAAATTPSAATPTDGTELEKNKKMRAEAEQALEKIRAELSSYPTGKLTTEQDLKRVDLIKARSALAEILRIIDIEGRIIEKQKEVDKRLDPESQLQPAVKKIVDDLRQKVERNSQLKNKIVKIGGGSNRAIDSKAIINLMNETGYGDKSDPNDPIPIIYAAPSAEEVANFTAAVVFLGNFYLEQTKSSEGTSRREELAAKELVLNDLEQIMKDTIRKYPEVFGTAEKPKKPSLNLPLTGRGIPEKYCPVCKTIQSAIKNNEQQIIEFIKEYAVEQTMNVNRIDQLIDILFKGKKGKKGRLVDGYLGPTTLAFMVYASKGKLSSADYPVLGVPDQIVKESLQKVCNDFRIEDGKQMNQEALNTIIQTISSPSSFMTALQDMGKLPKAEIVAESKNIRSLIIKEIYEMMKQG